MSARGLFLSRNELLVLGIGLTFMFAIIGSFACLSEVQPNESVVVDCDGDLTVWRAPEDAGIRWDGLCRTATYNDAVERDFREEIMVDGARVTIRGDYLVNFPQDARDVLELYRAYGRQDRLLLKAVDAPVHEDISAAAADPAWRKPKGGAIKRELKNALEYGLRRISPTGDIWTSHEARHLLEDEIQRRLDARVFPAGVTVTVQLGFVTER